MWPLLLLSCRPPPLLHDGRLVPCPASPNCVTSEAGADELHAVAPLPWVTPDELLEAVNAMPRTNIVLVEPDFVQATFTTRLMRFVDDVAFRFDQDEHVVHVRSASRIGYGDRGVNRARVDALRAQLETTP